ncbi:P-loop containing nucleoside triphosphate hydrolase protein [Aspergillus transmontanensis]|uniref:P-loop containing nucleoside triphosphate hydrolase protein n=1 Tax=Aspergillus transmontanensis TaxID=1034304 RepID=A0A5N6VYH9_9EURO|nr:P-loop containing nucleoside triphosphate hydrolase protein [Aspergillus transmontanensis]
MLRTTIRKIFTFTVPPLYYFMLSTLRGFLSQLCPCRKMECRQNTSRFPSLLSSLWGPRRPQQSLSISTSTQTQTQPPAPAPAPKIDIASTLQKKRSAEQDRVSRETAQKELVDEIENLVGLENVKRQLLGVQNWVQICRRHGREPRNEWYNIVFQGNPGTGKSTIARIYAKMLYAIGISDSNTIKETSGRDLAIKGPQGVQRLIKEMVNSDSPSAPTAGVLIVDNPHTLMPSKLESHKEILDYLLQAMERKTGRIIVVFISHGPDMETFLHENPRVQRRTCSTVSFADFDRHEILQLLGRRITEEYGGKMQVEGGQDGQYMQAAARRLARSRGEGFTNIYAVRQLVETIAHRQAECLMEQQDIGMEDVDYFFFSKDDILGPNPSDIRSQSAAWTSLQSFVGQEPVKASVREVFGTVEENYWREVKNQKRLLVRVNRVFAGPPGTGKTTAAKLYAQILSDLGLLSSGEVTVKPLSAFNNVSDTDGILSSTVGKALIIDMNTPETDDNDFQVSDSVLDMLIKELSANGENRCTILVGSDHAVDTLLPELKEASRMLEHQVVRFEPLTREQMEELFQAKLQEQDVDATPEAFQAAMDILESARMRKDFDNARGIERLLTAANRNFDQRRSRAPDGPLSQRVLEPEYFNADLVGGKAALAFREELRHSIVPDDIISVLKRYHNEMKIAWFQGHEPRARVPCTLVFKGASGTGKKTVARHLSALYYKMGVLKTAAMVECSVSDLVTTSVSHTSIRTRSQLERGRGKLLYVEDAHRLGDNEYTLQAMDELIYLLPKLSQEMVVVLAGPSQELDHLLANRPRLASLFQEEIPFRNPTPRECLRLLDRRLEEEGVQGPRLYLTDPREATHREFTRAIQILSMFPCWGNARDIGLLARWMVSVAVKDLPLDGTALPEVRLTDEQAMACMIKLFNLKRDRLRFNQDPKARTLPRILSQPRTTERGGVRFPV